MLDQKPEDLRNIKIPDILPVIPIYNAVVFPAMTFPIEVYGPQSISLIDEVMAKDRLVGIVTSRTVPLETKPEDLFGIGTGSMILKMAKPEDNKAQLLLQGIGRFKITEFLEGTPYIQVKAELIEDEGIKDIETEALMTNLVGLFDRIVKLSPFLPQEFSLVAKSIAEPGVLADMIASIINASPEEKQNVLEIQNVKKRLKEVTGLVNHQVD
ncbi:MAG: LON peptidase substrate-binding domain-containing protein, partial [Thermodesulfobacteriota bacterium]|nr:LON peptidase substrate-binding domain-containing protein [Thermodesulfobacteriota bacterium]